MPRRALRRFAVLLAFAPMTVPGPIRADDADIALGDMTVEASKAPRLRDGLPATVTVITSERIERELDRNIKDLVRFEPGISVSHQGSRFGLSGFSIRGMSGDRVQTEIDGVEAGDGYAIGDFSNASRDFIDLDAVKQVEILRGPSSALFGSDALGGVVSFVTRDPADFLDGRSVYADVTGGYYSTDDGYTGAATLAGSEGDWSGLLRLNAREGSELDNDAADPLSYDSRNVLAKLVYGTPADGGLELTFDRFSSESRSEVDSLEGVDDFSEQFGFPFFIETTEVTGDDERERYRTSLEQTWAGGVGAWDYVRWRGYHQKSETRQRTRQLNSTVIMGVPAPVSRDRLFDYAQTLDGLELTAGHDFRSGAVAHRLLYGVEYEMTDTRQLRDGTETDLLTGDTSNVVGPDTFPVRDFPKSETGELGIYIQDRIELMDGRLSIVPALRWDRYELEPEPDAVFAADNPGIMTERLEHDRLSPKLGLLWQALDRWQLYGQYAEGFRAPPFDDVNVGFTNLQFGYTTIPNPDLEPETSRGFELGARFRGETLETDVAVYRNRYEDFIEPFQVVGFDPVQNLIVFQSMNLSEVEIEGLELRGRWAPTFFPSGLSARAAAAYARGDNEQTGEPLNSVDPFNAVLGLDYDAPSGRWGTSLIARGAANQHRLDESEIDLVQTAGYVVLDAYGYWRPTERLRLRLALYNLTDRAYFEYADVRGLPASAALERFQRPGFNIGLTADWHW